MNKENALQQIAALAREHNLTIGDIAAYLGKDSKNASAQAGILKKLLGYLGGAFVFSGVGLLIGMIWDDIGSAQRVIVTLGIGMTAFITGFIFLRDPRFESAVTPCFLIAALMQPGGIFVFLNEYFPYGGDPQTAAMLVFGTMAVQYILAFTALKRTSLLFLALLFSYIFLGVTMAKLDISEELAGMIFGVSLLCLAGAIDKTQHRKITPFGYFFGGICLLVAYWAFVEDTWLDLSYLGLNAFIVYLSLRLSSRTLLFVSVIGLISYLSYFTYEYFADITGWPVALIVMGLVMIGLSAYAVKLGQKIGSARRP